MKVVGEMSTAFFDACMYLLIMSKNTISMVYHIWS